MMQIGGLPPPFPDLSHASTIRTAVWFGFVCGLLLIFGGYAAICFLVLHSRRKERSKPPPLPLSRLPLYDWGVRFVGDTDPMVPISPTPTRPFESAMRELIHQGLTVNEAFARLTGGSVSLQQAIRTGLYSQLAEQYERNQ